MNKNLDDLADKAGESMGDGMLEKFFQPMSVKDKIMVAVVISGLLALVIKFAMMIWTEIR